MVIFAQHAMIQPYHLLELFIDFTDIDAALPTSSSIVQFHHLKGKLDNRLSDRLLQSDIYRSKGGTELKEFNMIVFSIVF